MKLKVKDYTFVQVKTAREIVDTLKDEGMLVGQELEDYIRMNNPGSNVLFDSNDDESYLKFERLIFHYLHKENLEITVTNFDNDKKKKFTTVRAVCNYYKINNATYNKYVNSDTLLLKDKYEIIEKAVISQC